MTYYEAQTLSRRQEKEIERKAVSFVNDIKAKNSMMCQLIYDTVFFSKAPDSKKYEVFKALIAEHFEDEYTAHKKGYDTYSCELLEDCILEEFICKHRKEDEERQKRTRETLSKKR